MDTYGCLVDTYGCLMDMVDTDRYGWLMDMVGFKMGLIMDEVD
jgi:hypothetical protein